MDLSTVFLLGLIEGLTEFLPVSSTGHLMLAARALGAQTTEALSTFMIAIQLGAILAVVVLYGKRLLEDRALLMRVGIAFVPTAVIGLVLYKAFKHFLSGGPGIVCAALLVGGIFLVLFEKFFKGPSEDHPKKVSYAAAAAVGALQTISIIPGVSRAAATIVAGRLLGMTRKQAVEFSFLLAVPTMTAATALDLMKSAPSFSRGDWQDLAIGFMVSFFVAVLSIRCLLKYVKGHDLAVFGVYRVIVAVIFYFYYLR